MDLTTTYSIGIIRTVTGFESMHGCHDPCMPSPRPPYPFGCDAHAGVKEGGQGSDTKSGPSLHIWE